jgi:Flp pilus assembly protein TadG
VPGTDKRWTGSGNPQTDRSRGSFTVELVVLTPVIALFLLVALGLGRYALASEQVVGGARAAADAVAVASSASTAQQAAVAAATPVLQSNHSCIDPNVIVDSVSFAPGAIVKVSVSCRVEFSDLLIPGFPGSATIKATEGATIDLYRATEP